MINNLLFISFTGFYHGAWKIRMMNSVWKILWLEAHSISCLVYMPLLSGNMLQIVGSVKLDSGIICR